MICVTCQSEFKEVAELKAHRRTCTIEKLKQIRSVVKKAPKTVLTKDKKVESKKIEKPIEEPKKEVLEEVVEEKKKPSKKKSSKKKEVES